MATNRQLIIRAFVRAAKLQVTQSGTGTIKSVLESIVLGRRSFQNTPCSCNCLSAVKADTELLWKPITVH